MQNIIVTGGLGFIGHNVVRILEKEHRVTIVDNCTTYNSIPQAEIDYLMQCRKARVNSPHANIDIRDVTAITNIVSTTNPDTIIHLASVPRQKIAADDPVAAAAIMINGLINLLEAAVASNVKTFVFVSSSMVYGDFESGVTEDAECKPKGHYARLKLMGEKLVEDYCRITGIKAVIIRPSAVYGEYDVTDRVVAKFITAAIQGNPLKVNGPKEVLDFTHVSDTAAGIALAATSPTAQGIYNITRSDPNECSLQQAAELIVKIAGRGGIQLNDPDSTFPSRGRLSIDKAKLDLGYDPIVNINEGFNEYFQWMKTCD